MHTKSYALRFDLNTCKVSDDVTSNGRLFHVVAATATKARLPIIQSRVDGTASAEVENECRHCWPGIWATCCRVSARKAGGNPWMHSHVTLIKGVTHAQES